MQSVVLGEFFQNRSGPLLVPARGCGRAFCWISAAMVDYAHSFDVRTFGADAFGTVDAGTLRADAASRRPQLPTVCDTRDKSHIFEFSRRQIAALFVVFAFIAVIPVLLHP